MKKKIIAAGIIGVAALSSVGAAYAFSQNGMNKRIGGMQSQDTIDAIEANDYDAFIASVDDWNEQHEITEEEFAQIVAHHAVQSELREAIEANDYDAYVEALESIRPELVEKMTEDRFERQVEVAQAQQAVIDAIENSDYDAWVEAILEMPNAEHFLDMITEEEFQVLVQIHNSREEGDFEEAQGIAESENMEYLLRGGKLFGDSKGFRGEGHPRQSPVATE